jgi:hypothetical protein
MRKCLSSFNTYIRSRSSKILDLISFLPNSSIPSYTIVHTSCQNNIGILFQFLPKIQYYINLTAECDSIVTIDEYAKHIISPEELRYMDYSLNMKNKRYTESVRPLPLAALIKPGLGKNGSLAFNPLSNQILHSLPIVYPYDESESNLVSAIRSIFHP